MDNSSNNNKMHENGNESTLGLTTKMISLEQIQIPFTAVCFKLLLSN